MPHCVRCDTLLSDGVAEGLCPKCLTDAVFADNEDMAEEDSALGGKRIGAYELVERIARGGMGVVYRARQVGLNRAVAVKILLDPVFASAEERARFRAEAAAAAALQHPNIVAIHEIGEADGRCFFSMDLVEGEDLAALTAGGPLPASDAASLMVKIARAIHYTHERGILHRDLKPSNVLVDAAGQPHVTDFGLAKRMTASSLAAGAAVDTPALTMTGQVLGTPGYMSPEQAAAKKEIGPAADIYSLGALLFHLLTARAPFLGPTPTAVLRQVEDQDPIAPALLNPAVPPDLETICLKCLNKEPSRRYAGAGDLADDLERFLRHEPILARPTGRAERFSRWCRRNPVMASLIGAVAVLLIVVAVGSFLSSRRLEADRRAEAALRVEAEARLRQGDRLINFMLGDLADRLEPVGRLDILESAIRQVDQFYAQAPSDYLSPESQRHRANTLFQFATIHAEQGRLAESITNYHDAIAAYERVLAAHGTNLQWRFELGRTRNDLGIVYLRLRDFTNGIATLDRALEERSALLAQQPTNALWLGGYAATAMNLGVAERRLKDLDKAADYCAKSEQAIRLWIRVDPASTTAKERLATVRGAVGRVLADRNQLDAAAAAFGEKALILRDLLRQDPQHTRRQADLELGLSYVTELYMRQSNYDAALSSVNDGANLGEKLVSRDPSNREWLDAFVADLTDRGEILAALNRPEEALANYRRVWELSEPQAGVARQYSEWLDNWRQSLESAEKLERAEADRAQAQGQLEKAGEHRHAADELRAKLAKLK